MFQVICRLTLYKQEEERFVVRAEPPPVLSSCLKGLAKPATFPDEIQPVSPREINLRGETDFFLVGHNMLIGFGCLEPNTQKK